MMIGKEFARGVGTDFAGLVEAAGPGVKRFKVGDSVFGAMTMKASSTFADTIITKEATAALMPAALSFGSAATLPIAGSTGWIGLVETAYIRSDQRVLINGCLGSVAG